MKFISAIENDKEVTKKCEKMFTQYYIIQLKHNNFFDPASSQNNNSGGYTVKKKKKIHCITAKSFGNPYTEFGARRSWRRGVMSVTN